MKTLYALIVAFGVEVPGGTASGMTSVNYFETYNDCMKAFYKVRDGLGTERVRGICVEVKHP